MYPSHQRSNQCQIFREDVSISPEQYPTPDTRRGCIHLTRAVSNARNSKRMYPSHQSSIQRQTLGVDVSISPEQFPMTDTRKEMYPPH
ncbi:hypothetical protein ElyMa_004767200 [Elysia marginata]|uniref:Uncharacterized protein n=1 Tax=Elysia marginata TaxID=1093978 RepID=A0AAV4IFZ0_9GAST|nr:hypothetical protein ElyMa_004767200 [Elysia marginata]